MEDELAETQITHQSRVLVWGAIFALLAVALGAFGAHGLKNILSESALNTFETGVRYQMYHALGLLAVGLIPTAILHSKFRTLTAASFTVGISLFSGSLYGYTLTEIRWLVFLTPIGGFSFLLGWMALISGILMSFRSRDIQ